MPAYLRTTPERFENGLRAGYPRIVHMLDIIAGMKNY